MSQKWNKIISKKEAECIKCDNNNYSRYKELSKTHIQQTQKIGVFNPTQYKSKHSIKQNLIDIN